jgi:DNA-binding NtrC family response regulator
MSSKQTILVVDDEAPILETLAAQLETSYDVLVARDGLDAICLYERNAERVAAIVTDLNMPRLNGRLVTEWIHHISPQLPVIIMSGGVRNTDLEDLLQSSSVTFLAKPFDLTQLEALLDTALGSRLHEAA